LDIYSAVNNKELKGLRQSRKSDHLHHTLQLPDGPGNAGFADVTLIHNCLPDIAWSDIALDTSLAGIALTNPVIINAITGGAVDVTEINSSLAQVAKLTGAAMAVGSQYSALENDAVWESYQIVRRVNPEGIIIANLGAHASSEQARIAIDMIGADALQIHLNAAQEIIMAEGDRDFFGYLDNIARIASEVNVPVIVKEVGCGIAREAAARLASTGVQAIDVGGRGGTNFVAIEAARSQTQLPEEMLQWGIPTVVSALEAVSVLPASVQLIVSGGIRSPLDMIKSMAFGASAVAIAAPVLRIVCQQGVAAAVDWLQNFLHTGKRYMMLVGAKDIKDLQTVPFIIGGNSREWLETRKIDITHYANRKKHG